MLHWNNLLAPNVLWMHTWRTLQLSKILPQPPRHLELIQMPTRWRPEVNSNVVHTFQQSTKRMKKSGFRAPSSQFVRNARAPRAGCLVEIFIQASTWWREREKTFLMHQVRCYCELLGTYLMFCTATFAKKKERYVRFTCTLWVLVYYEWHLWCCLFVDEKGCRSNVSNAEHAFL